LIIIFKMLVFPSTMRNMIFPHCTSYKNYTPNLFPNFELIFL